MQKEYLVGYFIQKGSDLSALGGGEGISYKPGNQRIKTEKIDLPKLYQIISRKENVSVAMVTIVGVSPLFDLQNRYEML